MKIVPSLPQYVAFEDGSIMCLPFKGRLPKGGERTYGGSKRWFGVLSRGRYKISFRGKNYFVARLVCEAFHGPAPAGTVCMHLDENPLNNRPENLAWGTQKENLNAPGFIEYCKSRTGDKNPRRKAKK